MCIYSFVIDYSFYKICVNNNERCISRMIILSSSFVILTYATHTFSNSFELFLFALLLYYVSESLTFSNQILRKKEYVQYRYSKTESISERAKFHKLNLYLKTDSLRNCMQISTIVVAGFFFRPTFLIFSIIPIFFWLYRGIGSKVIGNIHFHMRIIALIFCALPSLLFIILIDSFCYGYISWGEIGMLDVSINSFVFTPLNFIKYNSNMNNLEKHGLHPRHLHLLVNMPLLFNILALFHLYNLSQYIHRLIQGKLNLLPSVRSIRGLMMLSTVTPLALLSIFPHQEPRFLIPLLLPMVYLYGTNILPEEEKEVMKANPNSFRAANVKGTFKYLYAAWLVINLTIVLFYGHLHQGGVIPALSHLSKTLKRTDRSTEIYLFSSHNYMLPNYLLLEKKPKITIQDFIPDSEAYKKRVHVFDEGSRELYFLVRKIDTILNNEKKMLGKKFKILLLLPLGLKYQLQKELNTVNLTFIEERIFYPHVSIEALSRVGCFSLDLIGVKYYELQYDVESLTEYIRNFVDILGLGLFEIK
ncbi:hypothetical protein WA026_011179 [Henosepilachna vigintioctopunctata]